MDIPKTGVSSVDSHSTTASDNGAKAEDKKGSFANKDVKVKKKVDALIFKFDNPPAALRKGPNRFAFKFPKAVGVAAGAPVLKAHGSVPEPAVDPKAGVAKEAGIKIKLYDLELDREETQTVDIHCPTSDRRISDNIQYRIGSLEGLTLQESDFPEIFFRINKHTLSVSAICTHAIGRYVAPQA